MPPIKFKSFREHLGLKFKQRSLLEHLGITWGEKSIAKRLGIYREVIPIKKRLGFEFRKQMAKDIMFHKKKPKLDARKRPKMVLGTTKDWILGPKRLITINLTERGKTYIALIPALEPIIQGELLSLYHKIYRYVADKQIQYAPINTGRLRKSLLRSLTVYKNRISAETSLKIELGTNIPYARWVNEMPTLGSPHLRHPPYNPGYTPQEDDPKALHNFYNFIRANTKKYAQEEFNNLVKAIYKGMKDVFGWTRWTQARALFTITED